MPRYVACMNPTAGSFVINPRLQRLFMTLSLDFPNQESLMKIYGMFVAGHLKAFPTDIQVRCQPMIAVLYRNPVKHREYIQAPSLLFLLR